MSAISFTGIAATAAFAVAGIATNGPTSKALLAAGAASGAAAAVVAIASNNRTRKRFAPSLSYRQRRGLSLQSEVHLSGFALTA